MGKNKLFRFAENETFPNLIQLSYPEAKQGVPYKGKWNSDFFKNNKPIVLELGCGKGEYTLGLAENDSQKNYLGIDVKGARIWRGCKTSNEKKLSNVGFIRTRIELIELYFDENEISEIWITFPDPQPKEFKARKRLTSPRFIEHYRKFLKKEGIIHLKTDNAPLFEYTLEMIKDEGHTLLYSNHDIYHSELRGPVVQIQTFYEKKYLELAQPIHYLKFQLNDK